MQEFSMSFKVDWKGRAPKGRVLDGKTKGDELTALIVKAVKLLALLGASYFVWKGLCPPEWVSILSR